MNSISFTPIGMIHTQFTSVENIPIQPSAAQGVKGHIILDNKYIDGLSDLDGFSHCYLLYHFHQSNSYKLKVAPFLDEKPRGVFATRAPKRPNAIGLSLVKLTGIEGNRISIENVDILNGTPLLDIKPYIPEMENVQKVKLGWISDKLDQLSSKRSDDRFK
jgi:tRNA-Thr(GGU) m(6)t(6)A37 methyltransferase TsaA